MEIPWVLPLVRRMSKSGIVPKRVWSRLPARGVFDLELPDGKVMKYKTVVDDGIGRGLYFGGIDGWTGRYVADVFVNRMVGQATNFVDVGANVGMYSLMAAISNPSVRISAFEPVPATCQHFRQLITLNGLERRINLHAAAAGESPGELPFHLPTDGGNFPVMASLNEGGKRGLAGTTILVPVLMLDDVLDGELPDLVKIDVQGFETEVLRGMRKTLTQSFPIMIIAAAFDAPIARLESELARYDYVLWHLGATGPVRVDSMRAATQPLHYYFALTPPHLCGLLE